MTGELLYEVRDGIGHVTFNRPQARNALTFAMYERVAEICDAAGSDPAVRVLLFTGAGEKAFAAGTDISQFRAFNSPEDALGYEERINRVLGVIEACPVPTLAAIAGACTGGGAGIAACCDMRIAATGMRFGFPIARTLGNCLSIANYARLVALLGPARVKEMISPRASWKRRRPWRPAWSARSCPTTRRCSRGRRSWRGSSHPKPR